MTLEAIADDYLRGMGFEGSQYVVYRHTDREHDHIHQTKERAVESHQQVARDTATAAKVLLSQFGSQQPDGEVILEGKRWRLAQKDNTVTITVLEENREILRFEGNQLVLFKPNPVERKDLKQFREQIAKALQQAQSSQQQPDRGWSR